MTFVFVDTRMTCTNTLKFESDAYIKRTKENARRIANENALRRTLKCENGNINNAFALAMNARRIR